MKARIPSKNLEIPLNTIFGIGRNYALHAKELHNEVPDEPVVFLKPLSSVIHSGDFIVLPFESQNVHHEVEVTVLLEKGGRDIPRDQAMSHVAAFGVGIDVTARDLQNQAKAEGKPWVLSKGYDTFAPLSDFVAAEGLFVPEDLDFELNVNGELAQKGNTRDMLFSIAELIVFLSHRFTLSAGDVIFTGTPAGVGPLTEGDRLVATLGENLVKLEVGVKRGVVGG